MPFDFNDLSHFGDEAAAPPESRASDDHPSPHDTDDHIPPNATVYQTTGPNAYTKAIEAADGSGNPAVNPRSCVTCRRRKVKCDKQMPCTTCRRALIPCIFPAPGRKPRQPRPRDPNAPQKNFSKREAELVKRLKKLEGIVEELSGQIDVDGSKASSPDTTQTPAGALKRATSVQIARSQGAAGQDPSMSPHAASVSSREGDSVSETGDAMKKTRQKFGRLVLNDHKGKTRYVSSAFWSRMNDELDSLRKEATELTDDADDSEFDETPESTPVHNQTTHDHHAFLLGYRSADVDLRKLYPVPSHIWFLWKIYQDTVEPLIKIVHVPTADTLLREASRDLDALSPGNQALVFAIFFAAVVATEPEDAEKNFNTSKENLVAQYRFSAEQALAKADFLTTSDFAVIQALVIFLILARRYDSSRFCWSMTGLLVRLALGMGLHRDGSFFDLTPFETEMRRRVWWAIMKIDLRSSEEFGTELTIHDRIFDTEVPLNINDADMTPEGTEPLVAKTGPTDMSVHLLRCEITKMARRVLATVASGGQMYPGDGSAALETAASTLEQLERQVMDTYFSRMKMLITEHSSGDTKDEVYWMAQVISRIVMAKMSLVIYQPVLFNKPEKLSPDVRQRIYVSALEILESDTRLHRDARAHPFRWLFMTYSTWQPIAYVLVESIRRSWTPLTERAWEAVCSFQRVPLETTKHTDQAAVLLPLRKLFLYVRKHRAVELARLQNDLDEARRLDKEEQANRTEPWFGRACGADDRMSQVRQKWWSLIQPDGNAAAPSSAMQPNDFFASPPLQSDGTGQSQARPDVAQNGRLDLVNMSEAQMQYIDQFMSQSGPNVADIYGLQNRGFMSVLMSGGGGGDVDMPGMNFSNATSTPVSNPATNNNNNNDNNNNPNLTQMNANNDPNAMLANGGMVQPQLLQSPNDQLPPFMWGNWLNDVGVMGNAAAEGRNDKLMEDVAITEDMNMLDQDFDWQDWTQTLRGLDMWQGEPTPGAR